MKIHELIWPEDRIDHIARHGVSPEEEVCSVLSHMKNPVKLQVAEAF
jgi:hypothetical protein